MNAFAQRRDALVEPSPESLRGPIDLRYTLIALKD